MGFKIILTGVSGRIGSQVLEQALRNPAISSIVALSRRPLPRLSAHKKLETVVVEDFTEYADEVIAKLAGADGCIWCMTTTVGETALELDYPRAFAEAFAPILHEHAKHFRYLHLTGGMVERDQSRTLWMKNDVRKIKGQGEIQMIDFAKSAAASDLWHTVIARPGMVVQRGTYIGEVSMTLSGTSGTFIRSDELALALIDAVMYGSEELLLPRALLQRGRELAVKRGY